MITYRVTFHDRRYATSVQAANDDDAKRLVEGRYPERDFDLIRGEEVVAKYRPKPPQEPSTAGRSGRQ